MDPSEKEIALVLDRIRAAALIGEETPTDTALAKVTGVRRKAVSHIIRRMKHENLVVLRYNNGSIRSFICMIDGETYQTVSRQIQAMGSPVFAFGGGPIAAIQGRYPDKHAKLVNAVFAGQMSEAAAQLEATPKRRERT